MLDAFFIFVGMGVSFYIGKLFGMSKILNALRNDTLRYDPDEDQYFDSSDEENFDEESEEPAMKIYFELDNDMIFAYSEENNKFLAMGKSVEELGENLRFRFPGTVFSCTETSLEASGLI